MTSKTEIILGENHKSIVHINIPKGQNFIVVGNIHSQFFDLLNLFNINGYPWEDELYLFNEDFVDRGIFGIGVITALIAFEILYPNYFFLYSGNHDDTDMNRKYDFRNEVIPDKYDAEGIGFSLWIL